VPWHTLPRDLLEQQLEAVGFERTLGYETGIKDTADHTESLTDYPDEPRAGHHRCPGSNIAVNGDRRIGRFGNSVICSTCDQVVSTYLRSRPPGLFKISHST
jgi:hypothetical protein